MLARVLSHTSPYELIPLPGSSSPFAQHYAGGCIRRRLRASSCSLRSRSSSSAWLMGRTGIQRGLWMGACPSWPLKTRPKHFVPPNMGHFRGDTKNLPPPPVPKFVPHSTASGDRNPARGFSPAARHLLLHTTSSVHARCTHWLICMCACAHQCLIWLTIRPASSPPIPGLDCVHPAATLRCVQCQCPRAQHCCPARKAAPRAEADLVELRRSCLPCHEAQADQSQQKPGGASH